MGDFMTGNYDFKGNKGFRLIYIFERLSNGELIKKRELAQDLAVSEKSIQRDIQDLRMYLAETRFYEEEINITYDKTRKGYYLKKREKEYFKNKEILVLSKILLESRTFRKNEIRTLLTKLFVQSTPAEKKHLETAIKNHQTNNEVKPDEIDLMDQIWQLSTYILEDKIISFNYLSKDELIEKKNVKPISIMFSDDYFYLTTINTNSDKYSVENFRLNKIKTIKVGSTHSF
jgi:predicted DNA-binding transcriptional regulator YafY